MVAAALAAVPFVVALLSAVGAHWHPVGDQAIEIMRIRDVGSAHTPLVGQWSRWGWAHPGPLLFFLLAPFFHALGNDGVLLGVAVLNLAAALAVVLAAARVAPTAALLAGAVTVVLAHSVGLDLLIDPWNPWAAFFPFLLFLVLVWVTASGEARALPALVVVGSLVLQLHASYFALVVGLTAVAAVAPVRAALRRTRDREVASGPGPAATVASGDRTPPARARRMLAVAALAGVILWIPPLVQQVSSNPGNLTKIARYATQRAEPSAGWDTAVGTMGTQLRPAGPWVTGDEQSAIGFERHGSAWIAVVTLAVTAGLGALAWSRGRRLAGVLALVALLAIGLSLLATARVTGPVLPYVIAFWRPVVALTYLSIAWSVVALVERQVVRRGSDAIALLVLAAFAIVAVIDAPAAPPVDAVSRAVGALGPSTAAALQHRGRYLVKGQDPATLDAGRDGLALYLEERGYHVFHQRAPLAALQFGSFRLASRRSVDGVIVLASTGALQIGWRPPAGAQVVARYDPLTPRRRAQAERLDARIRYATHADVHALIPLDARAQRDLAVRQGASRRDVEALGRLQRAGQSYLVYLAPVGRSAT
jgi:hypothetical protein